MALPRKVVSEDHRLEKEAESTSAALAELRWHWTLNEENDKRVSFTDYAKSVGRSIKTIQRSVKTFDVYTSNPGIALADARTRANLSEDRLAAVEAVAKARGVTLETAEHKRRNESRRVQQMAAEKAEQNGTSIEEEAPKVARWIVKSERAEANTKAARHKKMPLRLIEAESKMMRMISLGTEVVGIMRGVEWNDDAVEVLEGQIATMRTIVHLMDRALIDVASVDWDEEFAKLTEATS